MIFSVLTLFVARHSTLVATIYNVDCRPKAWRDPSCRVRRVWLPSAINNMQHTWLGWLGGHQEPEARSKVQPSVCDQLGLLEEDGGVAVHGDGEGAVVVVPAQLFRPPAVILFTCTQSDSYS